ncbi:MULTISPECIES: dicarboxylate/amino acid:cation symporter [Duncaniella]|uniref:Dicarboxylate/amino acid:cation symporter n=3 Tax=Duncaniella TaxID=2518495 RepID=A0A4P7W5H3_9BACT|nr:MULTISPECIES: dicarboxylate/amino acid:cation symporter [Duncaniella]MBJ2189310.1 dicarboxylate/amino acid:cation symporter [Muribaculaceae bacterium]MCX4283603.1 dicarboxylate/amino acid:cation symporter [Duncaniella dubosii]QCD43349.1 dicarboxylate/amino acid:cation symporter [Duncaniella dubosii]
MKKLGLLPRILIAIVLGIAIGYISPMWFARIMATFNTIFSQFLGFMIPMIIVGFVAPAIADIGGRAGKLLVVTAAIAYIATFFAGILSYLTGTLSFPSLIGGEQGMALLGDTSKVLPFFNIEMPPLMTVMTALVFAFMFGLGMAFVKGTVLRKGFDELRDIVSKTIDTAILPLLPFYIFGIFLNMTLEGQVEMILKCFVKIIVIIFILHVFILVLQYCIASLFARKNPFSMLRTMLPAYFTALGTQSSAATIPVTLRQAIKMGVSEDIAGFVIPLCATIHMSGSTLKIVACALALMIMHDQPHDLGLFCHFIGMLGITIIAAPGIPGGAIMASIGLLQSILGFDEQMVALMIALYIAMDSFGTACNVTGDGAIAAIIDRIFTPNKSITANR